MQIETAWVKPPPQIGGLDHLAVQAPCINIYGRMLPGITNVTDRARYYSFYPWLIWAFDQAGHRRYDSDFIERFRRADVLYCLIAQRHAHISDDGRADDHAAALVGSDTLREVAQKLGAHDKVRLSDFSLHEGAKKRYFANLLGGLGQYYIGVLRELAILDGDSTKGVKYSTQIGKVLAECMDAGVDRSLFLRVVDADVADVSDLDALHAFCPCQLARNAQEQKILGDLFFVRGPFHNLESLPRRRTLQLILHLAAALPEDEEISEVAFRSSVYTRSLPGSSAWIIPAALETTREKWAVYARNELLAVAVQGLFFSVLDGYEESSARLQTSAQIVDEFLQRPEVIAALAEVGAQRTFSECVADSHEWLPALNEGDEELHEVQLAETIVGLSHAAGKSPNNRHAIIVASLRVLIALASRADTSADPYTDLVFDPGYFSFYPINLNSLASCITTSWSSMSTSEWLRWLLTKWGIDTHLRVALRKLRGQGRSTFRIRPSDFGLEVIDIPAAVHTRPRFSQAFRILRDIGALEETAHGWRQSGFGRAMMELGDAP